jgi:hypothetical protein
MEGMGFYYMIPLRGQLWSRLNDDLFCFKGMIPEGMLDELDGGL